MLALFVPTLIGGLAGAMGSLAGRAILSLGIGAVSYTGITLGVNEIKQQVISSMSGLPVDAVNLLAFFWVDKAITVIFSATATALAMKTIGGTLKKFVLK